jgi:hypothetical protein
MRKGPACALAAAAIGSFAAIGCGGSHPAQRPAARAAHADPASAQRADGPSEAPQEELLSRRPFGVPDTNHACTRARPCHFVVRLGPTSSQHRVIVWDTPQRYTRSRPLFIMAWADDKPLPYAPVGVPTCGLHFTLRAVVVGFAMFCASGHQPIHFQFTNVTLHQVTVTVGYYANAATPPRPATAQRTPPAKRAEPKARPQPKPQPRRTPPAERLGPNAPL